MSANARVQKGPNEHKTASPRKNCKTTRHNQVWKLRITDKSLVDASVFFLFRFRGSVKIKRGLCRGGGLNNFARGSRPKRHCQKEKNNRKHHITRRLQPFASEKALWTSQCHDVLVLASQICNSKLQALSFLLTMGDGCWLLNVLFADKGEGYMCVCVCVCGGEGVARKEGQQLEERPPGPSRFQLREDWVHSKGAHAITRQKTLPARTSGQPQPSRVFRLTKRPALSLLMSHPTRSYEEHVFGGFMRALGGGVL